MAGTRFPASDSRKKIRINGRRIVKRSEKKEFQEFKIYCNYGVLSAEKRNVYTYGAEASTAVCSDEMLVRLPENAWFSMMKTQMGRLAVETSWGSKYDINEVLQGNEAPSFYAVDKNGEGHRVMLVS